MLHLDLNHGLLLLGTHEPSRISVVVVVVLGIATNVVIISQISAPKYSSTSTSTANKCWIVIFFFKIDSTQVSEHSISLHPPILRYRCTQRLVRKVWQRIRYSLAR